ncbi:hypothetical protein NJF44_08670 [Pseudomonas guariconensis]|uniref:HD domain-containing protein n=1 Tax=Pseudomonas TaxID=286 RepID=UPI0020968A95|nr:MULTISPECIES: HD domain-containing protein [Pseudomonas]MCO7643109.1 hypothetical protein [Pseudomonas sp. S 311-6]MCO7514844.1 hypothetical protein [Pseudomonas putida]MCO7565847.1 hypothetical protein [Pseudomonas mosselii]MCO7605305.1 hypothetical protein [Pseudomonas guariconensis]MCO7616853.1 hypothetical protein [Pseudomonas guariconensis]
MPDNNLELRTALRTLQVVMDACANIKLTEGGSVLEHSLWSAQQAMVRRESKVIVVASLFHDVGHYICSGDPELTDYSRDREHAALGAAWLSRWFPSEVCAPIALHIDAKRYLATVDVAYYQQLGLGSAQSLEHQGGVMSPDEIQNFRSAEHFKSALLIREFDDTPYRGEKLWPYSWYEHVVISVMR